MAKPTNAPSKLSDKEALRLQGRVTFFWQRVAAFFALFYSLKFWAVLLQYQSNDIQQYVVAGVGFVLAVFIAISAGRSRRFLKVSWFDVPKP